jgi:hypothetical protein
MKPFICFCLVTFFTLTGQSQYIGDIVTEVSLDSLVKTVRILSGEDSTIVNGDTVLISSRSNSNPGGGNDLAADYIKERFLRYNLPVEEQVFNIQGWDGRNIIATQTGAVHPDEIYIICAHYDAVTDHCADDNASGVAAVLEAARILSQYSFDYTIIYASWDREENGQWGSKYYAQEASSEGYNIVGVINLEMFGYDSNNDGRFEIHTNNYASSLALKDRIINAITSSNLLLSQTVVNPGETGSDHSSFWNKNYGAVCVSQLFFHGDANPYYHTSSDRIDKFNLQYFNELSKLVIISLASSAELTLFPPASVGDYRSFSSGDWGTAGLWQIFDGTDWVPAETVPSATDGKITIRYGHTVTIGENLTIDQVFVASGGQISVAPGVTLTIDDCPDDEDFIVSGTGKLYNEGTIVSTGRLVFRGNSTYMHSQNGGIIPLATWDANSNCTITGVTNLAPQIPPATQPFKNFIWNCSSQISNINLSGQLMSIAGDFSASSTNNHSLILCSDTEGSLEVAGDLHGTGSSKIFITNGAAAGMVTVRDLVLAGGTLYICGSVGTGTLNVERNCSITGGTLNMSSGNAEGVLNIAGDFSHTGGMITETSSGYGTIYFTGQGRQLYTSDNGRVSNAIDFVVNCGAILQMGTGSVVSYIKGGGTFTLSPGSTLGITSSDGITSTGNSGNIQCSGGQSYDTGANYIYNGTANQSTGNGLPSNLTGKLTINNTGTTNKTVTLSTAFTVAPGGSIDIVSGIFAAGTNLTMSGGTAIYRCGGSMSGTPSGSYDLYFNGQSMTTSGEVTGQGLNNVTVELYDGEVLSLDKNIAPDGDLTIASCVLDIRGYTCNRSEPGGSLILSGCAALLAGGTGSMPAGFETYDLGPTSTVVYYGADQEISPVTYGNLVMSGTGVKTITAGSAVTVNTSLTTDDRMTIESTSLENSGSLIVNGSCDGRVTFKRQMRTGADDAGDYHFFSSPVGDLSLSEFISANPGKINQIGSEYQIWEWQESDASWPIVSSGDIVSGKGYNLDQTSGSDGNFSFTGSVVTVPVTFFATSPYSTDAITGTREEYDYRWANDPSRTRYGGGGWNMMGNPFTSALDVSAFIAGNNCRFDPNYQAVYVYDGSEGEHGTYHFDLPYVQAGQGFFVLAMRNGLTFSFYPGDENFYGMQAHSIAAPMLKSLRAVGQWPGLTLKVRYGENESSTSIVFDENMTTGLDPGYDIGQISTGPGVEIYTALVEDNGINFARQALPLSGYEENIVPVGLISDKGGEVTFSADVVPMEHVRFWLEDRETGVFTDLNTHSYTATLPPEINGIGRFFIYASSGLRRIAKMPRSDPGQMSIKIWTKQSHLYIEGSVSNGALAALYDIQGHKVFEARMTDVFFNDFIVPCFVKGVYVLRISDGDKTYVRKMVFL